MATVNVESPRPTAEPELHLLLPNETEQPLWKSLFRNVDDLLFPKKLPPLVLTSRPVPVKDIWGEYNYKKPGALGSTAVHVLLIAVIIGGTLLGRRVVQQVTSWLPRMKFRPCHLLKHKLVVVAAVVTAINSKLPRGNCLSRTCNRSRRQPW